MRKLELVRDYNATAHLYNERYREEQEVKITFLLGKLRPKEGDVLIDVGCGTGLLFDYVSSRLMVGVDISINMLREAKKRAKDNVELILGDAEYLPIRDEVADIIVSITVLQLIGNQGACMCEILRCLRKGGSFGIGVLKKGNVPEALLIKSEVYESDTMKDVFCVGRKR